MKSFSIRLYEEDRIIQTTMDESTFTKKFTKAEVEANEHYLVKKKGVIVQINTNFNYIGCHDEGFNRVPLRKLTKETMLTLIKNADKDNLNFELMIDTDDSDEGELYYYQHEIRVLRKVKDETIEEYIDRLSAEFRDIEPILIGVRLSHKEFKYQIKCYVSGSFYIKTYRRGNDGLNHFDYMSIILNVLGLTETEEEVEKLTMLEKEVVPHPLSEFHIILDYLEDNKETLPEDVRDALMLSQTRLQTIADKHKNGKIYKIE